MHEFIKTYSQLVTIIAFFQILRYIVFAGVVYLSLRIVSKSWIEKNRIQNISLQSSEMFREFRYSLLTLCQYALILGALFNPLVKPYTRIYNEVSTYGWTWTLFTWLVVLFYHDAYFYWMHRTLHHPKIYRFAHKVHHLSTNPSPWAAQSFHPVEAFFEIAWIIPLVFILPLHRNLLLYFSLFSLAYNVYGHSSVEILPKSWKTHPVLKWLNTSTHHNGHHKYFKGNYGLYFLFWDRWMKTERN